MAPTLDEKQDGSLTEKSQRPIGGTLVGLSHVCEAHKDACHGGIERDSINGTQGIGRR